MMENGRMEDGTVRE